MFSLEFYQLQVFSLRRLITALIMQENETASRTKFKPCSGYL